MLEYYWFALSDHLLHQKSRSIIIIPITSFQIWTADFFWKTIFNFLMYDILQLNDMLVPELQDIAEQYAISNFKKLDKQELADIHIERASIS